MSSSSGLDQGILGPSGEHGGVEGRHGISCMTRLASLVVWTMRENGVSGYLWRFILGGACRFLSMPRISDIR